MTTTKDLWVEQTPQPMAVGEAKAFRIDFSDIGAPTAVNSLTAYDATGADVSGATLSGSNSISGGIVTLKKFAPASAQTYRLVCSVTIGQNTVYGVLDVTAISVTPASGITNGYTTRAAVLEMLRTNSTDAIDDTVVDALITAASRYIDTRTGRTFYSRTETHYFDVPEGRTLWLDDDLISVTTLTNGDGTVLTTTDYMLQPYNDAPYYAIKLKDISDVVWEVDSNSSAERVITLAGSWGFSATAPADISLACKLIAVSTYRNRFGENMTGAATITGAGVVVTPQDVPSLAAEIIRRYTRLV